MPTSGPSRTVPAPSLSPASIVRAEAAALQELAHRLDTSMREPFAAALVHLEAALHHHRQILLTGVGKSGLIAAKIAATLRSTGTPAHVLHPTEALHGDLGMLSPRPAAPHPSGTPPDNAPDILLALSASGETEELLALLPVAARLGLCLIAFTGSATSTLARAAAVVLDTSCSEEACPHNLAPTTSTAVMLALGDALALTLSDRRGFAPADFADLHPGGNLGRRLTRVRDLMHTGDSIPVVSPSTPMPDVIYEMSRKKLGITAVCADPEPGSANRRLLGILSDGDLRRMLGREGAHSLALSAGDVMHPSPLTIPADSFASAALALLEERSVTALLITTPDGNLQGVVHLHDLWKLNLP